MKFRARDPLLPPENQETGMEGDGNSPLPLLGQSDGATSQNMQLEVASYIEILSAELGEMAKAAELKSLAYFLEMARLEASIQVERHAASASEGQETV
jgi:hypothetical protein